MDAVMNVSGSIYFIVNLVRERLVSNVQFIHNLIWLGVKLARFGLRSLVILPLGLVLNICGDLLRLATTLACIWLVVILISLIKSLKPRYNFHSDLSEPPVRSGRSCVKTVGTVGTTVDGAARREQIFSPSSTREAHSNDSVASESGWPIKRYIENKFPILSRLLFRLGNESRRVKKICSPALSESDIELVYKRLSWAHTQIDIESVNWINQTLRTLWPSIKTLLNMLIFNDLLKPKGKRGNKELADESKKLSKQKPKLSVYISSRRKLDLIRKIEADSLSKYQSLVDHSLVRTTIYLMKLAIVYMKQFVIDYISYLFKRGQRRGDPKSEREKKFEINLEKLLTAKKKQLNKKSTKRADTQSWAGFDIPTENSGTKRGKSAKTNERKRKYQSAPPQVAKRTRRVASGLIGPRGMEKLRERRLKLADRFKRAYMKTKDDSNEFTIERIRLGDSIPMINGIKHIGERNDLTIEPMRISRQLVSSDERNMRFISELSYATDKKFQINLCLHPLLGQIRLVNLSVQIRCYLTLNHTISELNRDLKIFETPDDVLFPAINYVQLSLADVPSIDWTLDRPSPRRQAPLDTKQTRSLTFRGMSNYINGLIDPVDIINHAYFKYMVHSLLYVGLKWFQPFDIRIGPYLYLKTICPF